MKQIINLLLLIVFAFIPFQAYATQGECDSTNPANCLNGVGPAVTNPDSVRTTAFQVSKQTNSQSSEDGQDLSFIGSSAVNGLAVGDGFAGLGYWASFNYSDFSAGIPINSVIQPVASYDADQKTVFIGVNTLLMDALVIGLALGYENTDIDTAYNGSNNDTDGYTIAPYAAYLINDIFSADVVMGYTNLGTDTDRIDNVSGGTILGDFDAERWFIATNINASNGFWVGASVIYTLPKIRIAILKLALIPPGQLVDDILTWRSLLPASMLLIASSNLSPMPRSHT